MTVTLELKAPIRHLGNRTLLNVRLWWVSLYIRMLVTLGDTKTLVALAGEELFHEMGIGGEIWASLEVAAASTDLGPEQRFWALDGLVFAELKSGKEDKLSQRFALMEQLLTAHPLGDDEKLAYMMKRMLYQSNLGQADKVMASIAAMADRTCAVWVWWCAGIDSGSDCPVAG